MTASSFSCCITSVPVYHEAFKHIETTQEISMTLTRYVPRIDVQKQWRFLILEARHFILNGTHPVRATYRRSKAVALSNFRSATQLYQNRIANNNNTILFSTELFYVNYERKTSTFQAALKLIRFGLHEPCRKPT